LGRLRELMPKAIAINEYGPTEATVAATFSNEGLTASTSQIIGRAIDNTSVEVVSGTGEPVPIGFVGEIHISGPGVARGYLNEAKLTKQKFDVRVTPAGEERCYRTGDLGKWDVDGR